MNCAPAFSCLPDEGFLIQVVSTWICCSADVKVCCGAKRISFKVMAFIKAACNLYKTRGVHIKYACGIRMIANGGRIAGQSEDIVYAKGIGPQEFCLKPDCVAVAAGQVEMDSTQYFC